MRITCKDCPVYGSDIALKARIIELDEQIIQQQMNNLALNEDKCAALALLAGVEERNSKLKAQLAASTKKEGE